MALIMCLIVGGLSRFFENRIEDEEERVEEAEEGVCQTFGPVSHSVVTERIDLSLT
ncbi:hypothetical protein [Streptomyces sp. NPDC055036]